MNPFSFESNGIIEEHLLNFCAYSKFKTYQRIRLEVHAPSAFGERNKRIGFCAKRPSRV